MGFLGRWQAYEGTEEAALPS